jgi:hypothetical protein
VAFLAVEVSRPIAAAAAALEASFVVVALPTPLAVPAPPQGLAPLAFPSLPFVQVPRKRLQ